jgi:hypothetical protein
MIQWAIQRITANNFHDFGNLDTFFENKDYLMLSILDCAKIYPKSKLEDLSAKGFIIINSNYQILNRIESAGNSQENTQVVYEGKIHPEQDKDTCIPFTNLNKEILSPETSQIHTQSIKIKKDDKIYESNADINALERVENKYISETPSKFTIEWDYKKSPSDNHMSDMVNSAGNSQNQVLYDYTEDLSFGQMNNEEEKESNVVVEPSLTDQDTRSNFHTSQEYKFVSVSHGNYKLSENFKNFLRKNGEKTKKITLEEAKKAFSLPYYFSKAQDK